MAPIVFLQVFFVKGHLFVCGQFFGAGRLRRRGLLRAWLRRRIARLAFSVGNAAFPALGQELFFGLLIQHESIIPSPITPSILHARPLLRLIEEPRAVAAEVTRRNSSSYKSASSRRRLRI